MQTELSTPKTRRESEVWQACDDLWAGRNSVRALTGDNIRDQLVKLGYKRGSPNEIYRYRNSWKDSRGIVDEEGGSTGGEIQTSDPISRAVSLVYDQMRSQASDALEKITADYEDRLKASLLEEETLKGENAALSAQLAAQSQALRTAEERIAAFEKALREAERVELQRSEQLKAAKDQLSLQSSQHQALLLELKGFHEREIDLWRTQSVEAQKALTQYKAETQAERDRQGAIFSDQLMALKTELRQTLEERAQAKARTLVLEEQLKAIKKQTEEDKESGAQWQHRIERYLRQTTNTRRKEKRSKR